MFESNLVRIVFVPVYIVMTVFTAYLIWKNSASNDSLKNGGIAIAALLPVFIAVLPYLNIHEKKDNLVFNLIYDSNTKQIITGKPFSPYDCAYIPVFANLPEEFIKSENIKDFMDTRGLNLIEKGIVSELVLNFSSNWDYKTVKQITPFGKNITHQQSDSKYTKLNLKQVTNLFPYNPIISTPGVIVGGGLVLPPNSSLLTSTTNKERIITINNTKAKTTIKINPSSFMVIQKGLNGILDPDPQNMNRYFLISYNISLYMKPKRFEMYSPEMPNHERWYNNLIDIFKKMTWEEIEKKNKQLLLDNAVKEILDNKKNSEIDEQADADFKKRPWKQLYIGE
ncbi:hypothetical protein KAI92_03595 [Candidatus Parcubacteria bacterium]|nr:hypothetical protein [Candidatus Parcubacteria bacterium]